MGGTTSADWANGRLATYLSGYSPGWVVCFLGVNDIANDVPLETTKSNLQAVYAACLAQGCRLIICNVPPYEIDTQRRRVTLAGTPIKLTDREFDLAVFVFRRHGRIVSRETLLEQVWKLSSAVTTRTVDTHMSRLRKKLKLNGEHGWRLTAVYQHGYRLEQA